MTPAWQPDPPLVATADVVVVGAGSAGACAAIAAARGGASVVLVEKQAFLGGTSTAVLDTFYGFYTPGSRSLKVAGGISDEVVAGLSALGPVLERPNTYGAGTGVTYNSEHLKLVWERLVAESGVRVLAHAFLEDATVRDGRVDEVIMATKAGLARIGGRVFVDASGDADLCHFAGFGYELAGAVEPAQTLTTTFRMVNVDVARRRQVSTAEVHELMAEAAASGDYDLPRREGSDHATPVEGMIATVMTRIESTSVRDGDVVNASDPWLLSEAEMAGRRQAHEYARFLRDRVPGYEDAALAWLSSQIGVRETRRVYGDGRLTREDVLGARRFDDEVGLCGAPIEDHHAGADTRWQYLPDGEVVGIPYRTLLVRDAANVLVAGRCFSATHDAHASVRSMAQTMAMGQAAGTAAALAVHGASDPRAVDVGALRDRLRRDGAVLEVAREAEGAGMARPAGTVPDVSDWWLGFDIGGTRAKAGVVDAEGEVTRGLLMESDHRPFDIVWQALLAWADEAVEEVGATGLRGIGIAAPGLVEAGFGVRNLPGKLPGIEGYPMRERLEDRFGVPVRCANDGAAATLAEWRFGVARGCQDVVGLTLGTGVGAGVIIGGRLLATRHLAGGVSFGHATISVGGRTCLCGNVGCAETLVSANAVVGRMRDYVARKVPSSITDAHGRDPGSITFRTLVEGVEATDRVAAEIMAELCRDLGATIVTAIHAYDPEVVVLAGGIVAQADHFLPAVQAYVDRYAFRWPKDRIIPVLPAVRSDHAGLLGAVALVMAADERGAP